MDDEMKLKKQNLEAEKRLKKAEQDYLHVNQKFTERRTQWETLCCEKSHAVNRCSSTATFVDICNQTVEKLQKALDKLPTPEPAEEAVDNSVQFSMSNNHKSLAQDNMMIIQKKEHRQMLDREAKRDFRKMKHKSQQFSMVNSGKSSEQENMTILQQKAQCQELDAEVISDFKEIYNQLRYYRRRRSTDSSKAINDLLKEITESKKCRDKALLNCTLVCDPTSHESLRKSVEREIKVLKKLIRELKKDYEGKQHIKQYATNICKDYRQKARHLRDKKEYLSGQWDEEKKRMQEMKKKHDRIGTYPEAEYTKIGTYPTPEFIKMVNDNLP